MEEVTTKNSTNVLNTKGITKNQFMNRVYAWMMLGIFLTGIISFYVGSNPEWVRLIFSNRWAIIGLIVFQLGMVFIISMWVEKMPAFFAAFFYLVYSALVGITFSVLFLRYTEASIVSAFITASFTFGGLSAYGYIAKKDLGPIGSFCTMGLFGFVIITIMSLFIPSLMAGVAQKVISSIGIIVFAGLTAYDTQKIKELSENTTEVKKEAIHGALILYLDFINLFLNILRLIGQAKN